MNASPAAARPRTAELVVAAWQPDGPLLDVPAALVALDAAAAEAAGRDARLLVCPELTLTGYDIAPRAAALAEPAGGPMAQAVADIARRRALAIAWSWPERDGEQVHIAVELVDRDGTVLARHRKAHLYGPDEAAAYVPGDGAPAVGEIDGYRVGLLVCYDVEFPEQVRLVALAGADLLACPTALMTPYDAVSTLVVPTRAFENQMAIAYANRTGSEHRLTYPGLSCVVGPDGVDLARADDRPGLVVGTLTSAALDEARRANTHLVDRRPEIYAGLTR
ncbi:carbon-nitrogen hydrolase family protein [Nocardioides carbamazepini]|uniref:carbon-nitrogen hydrolase family protein n=1 Tax=Nocardioides carbamazepini TaxID=2854259 RepID=UPI00214A72A5|nr:carbon-nitrogen hydrolase family protein [Nocardioides carbamazepini]MCR1782930.1 carbon-nitrogen hydrolase family protein [Nocardioides carbamazepini]